MLSQMSAQHTPAAPTVAQFVSRLNDGIYDLYLLSLLLTADHEKADRCFMAAMEECLQREGAFMEWARVAARRAVCKHAVQIVCPIPEEGEQGTCNVSSVRPRTFRRSPFSGIFALCEFERFVFVMSVLEGEADSECAALLNCAEREVLTARLTALTRLARMESAKGVLLDDTQA